MNKRFYLLAAAAALILAGCAKESLKETKVVEGDEYVITATAILPSAMQETKIAMNDEFLLEDMMGDVKAAWETGDTFNALEKNGDVVTPVVFTLKSIDKGVGTFQSKGAKEPTEETTWTAVLGKTSVVDGKIVCKYDEQDGTLAKLGNFEYAVAKATGKEPVFKFADAKAPQLTYVMRVLLPAGIKYVEYNTGVIEEGGWTIEADADPVSTVSTTVREAVHMATLPAASTKGQAFYLAIPAIDYGVHEEKSRLKDKTRDAGMILTIMTSDKKQSTGKVLAHKVEGGCIATYNLSEEALIARPLASEAIDLGSVTYGGTNYPLGAWAPFNIGANFPTSDAYIDGMLFAWGETEPRTSFTKDGYKWVSGNDYSSQIGYKYTVSTAYTGDNYLVFDICGGGNSSATSGVHYDIGGTRYDAARVKWGSEWRMPSNEVVCNCFYMGHGRLEESIDTEGKVTAQKYDKGTYKNAYNFTSSNFGALVIKANGKELALYYTSYTENGKNNGGTDGRLWTATTDNSVYENGASKNYWNRSVCLNIASRNVRNGLSYQWDGLQIRPTLNK